MTGAIEEAIAALGERARSADRTGELLCAESIRATLRGAGQLIDLGRSLSQALEEAGRIAHGADHAWSASETSLELWTSLSRVEALPAASGELNERIRAGLQELVAAQLDAVAASTYPRSTQGST
jgi:hypothetical protein